MDASLHCRLFVIAILIGIAAAVLPLAASANPETLASLAAALAN